MGKSQINTKKTGSGTPQGIDGLIRLIRTLRGENGCPWDKEQTPVSMCVYLIEEVYELVDAITSGSPEDACEELGDVLFHILFIACLYKEKGHFDIHDAAAVSREKMTRRHPHVFGNASVDNTKEVKQQWNRIKMAEKNHAHRQSILDSVPSGLPPLMRAYRLSERAARIGFDWEDIDGVRQKVDEEWAELESALADNNPETISTEFGDLLFTLVNYARFAGIHPETALADAVKKFETRFKLMEETIKKQGKTLESASMDEMDRIWEQIKKT